MTRAGFLILVTVAALLSGCADDRHEERMRAAGPNPTLDALLKVAEVDAGARKFRQCAACHRITEGAPDMGGPNLHGVYGQSMGRTSGRFGYTAALRNAGGRWDASTLDKWLANPAKLVPGTTMQFAGVPDPLDRADIIVYLRSQSGAP
ncbi:c-type cytochrome [Novosphingobium kaempferiae]|uniref:c-type cytochrome n=1 Tax=Novosphingobium kaempferiae TaxID=2896849 RepID=UPI001E48411D|nr:c-type cytochrome [Novosphingobium kaempferiae]